MPPSGSPENPSTPETVMGLTRAEWDVRTVEGGRRVGVTNPVPLSDEDWEWMRSLAAD